MKKRYLLIALGVLLVFTMGWQIYRIFEQLEIRQLDSFSELSERHFDEHDGALKMETLPLDIIFEGLERMGEDRGFTVNQEAD